jgi:toxin HigB-1
MIRSFADAGTEDFYHGWNTARVRRFPADIHAATLRKLDVLEAATTLDELRRPPGNRLEALSGDLRGRWSIRVNSQWRIVFRWEGSDAWEVRLTDYH